MRGSNERKNAAYPAMRGMRRHQTTKTACQQFVSIELGIQSRGDLAESQMLFDRANALQKMIDLLGESEDALNGRFDRV